MLFLVFFFRISTGLLLMPSHTHVLSHRRYSTVLFPHPNNSVLPPFCSRPCSVHTANLHNRPTHDPSVLFPVTLHLVQPPNRPLCCLLRGFAMSVVWPRFQLQPTSPQYGRYIWISGIKILCPVPTASNGLCAVLNDLTLGYHVLTDY